MKIQTTVCARLAAWAMLCIITQSSVPAGAAQATNATARAGEPEKYDPPLGVTGTVRKHDGFTSEQVGPRNVHVWLPPSYESEPKRRYAVIYANDGQNQFDPKLSFLGVDWGLDETMTRLIGEGKVREAIVVAVWNTPKRLQEYLPAKAVRAANGTPKHDLLVKELSKFGQSFNDDDLLSDQYLAFIVRELKPFIDKGYRTRPGRGDTFMMGSSAGALISLYAISEYPNVFGGAACMSTHWPLADGLLADYFADRLPDPATHRIYFDFGTETLDKGYEPYQVRVDAAMEKRGYRKGKNWLTRKFEGHEHSERAWRKRVQFPLEFLLGPPDKGEKF